MNAAHTPVPWEIGIPYHDSITGLWNCHITRNGVAFITVSGVTKHECEANARLVAAAPVLLQSCKEAKKHLEPNLVEPGRTVFWSLVAAIKQAGAA